MCGHMCLCLCQQKVLGLNKILCRGHITSDRSQTLILSTWDMIFGQCPLSSLMHEKARSQQGVLRACLMFQLSQLDKTQQLSSRDKQLITLGSFEFIYWSLFQVALAS